MVGIGVAVDIAITPIKRVFQAEGVAQFVKCDVVEIIGLPAKAGPIYNRFPPASPLGVAIAQGNAEHSAGAINFDFRAHKEVNLTLAVVGLKGEVEVDDGIELLKAGADEAAELWINRKCLNGLLSIRSATDLNGPPLACTAQPGLARLWRLNCV